jgi:transaldolase
MIKVPATLAGLPAITALIADGLSINVTLIFTLARYGQVMEAYLAGLEQRAAAGGALDGTFSVASFFVSRVDSKVDAAIERALAAPAAGEAARAELAALRGQAAVANARLAYRDFERVFRAGRFRSLEARGAHVQRPLWASTSTKNPAYPDTLYVDELIGADTVNTMPPQTLVAFNDHGTVEARIGRDVARAAALFARLPELGVPAADLIEQLEPEGVTAFAKSFDGLLETLEARRREMVA